MQDGSPPTDVNLANRHIAALDFDLAKADVLERLKFQADFAKVAWQSLSLVNGGAIVALFTFIGNAKPTLNQHLIWIGFGCFAFGLAVNILSILLGFMSQGSYMRATALTGWNKQAEMHGYRPKYEDALQKEMKAGDKWHLAAIIACVSSLIAFVAGSAFSLSAVG
jgi:hypothetical protein